MDRHMDTEFSFSKLNQFHNFQYSLLRLPSFNFLRQVTNFIHSLTLKLGVIFNIVYLFKFSVLAYPGYHLVIKSVNSKAADFLKWRRKGRGKVSVELQGFPFHSAPSGLKLQPFNRATDPWDMLPPGPLSPVHLPRGA